MTDEEPDEDPLLGGEGLSGDDTAAGNREDDTAAGNREDDTAAGTGDGPGSAESDEPLGDVARRVDRQRERRDDDDLFQRAFEEVDVDEVADESVWSELEDEAFEETVREPSTASERDVRIVPKRDYCQRCQFFSAPPEMRCTYEGSEIVEMEDTDSFRVADCPVVRGDAELGGIDR